MIPLFLLSACGAGSSEGEQLACAIQQEYQAMTVCTAQVSVTADYGQRVYQYQMMAQVDGDETTLTLTAPDTVSGMTAHVKREDSQLEYDGIWMETGPLNEDGLTPVSAVPALLEAAGSGYIRAWSLEEDTGLLRLDCGDPEGKPGSGVETSLWFDPQTHDWVQGEVYRDGFRVILCQVTQFTRE
jgi:hypothetical protein